MGFHLTDFWFKLKKKANAIRGNAVADPTRQGIGERATAEVAETASIKKRHITAIVVGNTLEFYDFTTYAFFAVQIGRAFFPNESPFISLMLSLITFGAGFIMRPLGAIVIGRYADRKGRRPAMVLSFALMGIAILGLALTPSYAAIGLAAPALVVIWRLMQGFALGGESGPTMAYLIEAAPPEKRGAYGAWMYVSHGVAVIAAGVIGVAVGFLAGPEGLDQWGWRLAFLLGAAILPLGIVLRRNLPETLHSVEKVRSPTAVHAGKSSWPLLSVVLLGLALIGAQATASYVMNYMQTYASTTLGLPGRYSLGATIAMGCSYLIGATLGGTLSDRFGRKALMIWPRLLLIVLAWPIFYLIVRNGDVPTLLAGVFTLGTLIFMSAAATIVCITESIRKEIRGTGAGTILAFGAAIFGATTQPMVAWITHASGNPLSPAFYLMAFGVMGLIASALMKESAPRKMKTA